MAKRGGRILKEDYPPSSSGGIKSVGGGSRLWDLLIGGETEKMQEGDYSVIWGWLAGYGMRARGAFS